MVTAINNDMFTGEAISDPYTYYGRIREQDPVYWNELYELWVITRHDDLVWMTRHHELFSSEFWKRDTKAPYPAIDESDMGLYQFMREFFMDWFIQHDRPVHTDQRKVVHKWFNPKSMELWRPMVKSVIKDMLDESDQSGRMDVMKDFATPLPLFVIAQMMGMPVEDRGLIGLDQANPKRAGLDTGERRSLSGILSRHRYGCGEEREGAQGAVHSCCAKTWLPISAPGEHARHASGLFLQCRLSTRLRTS